MTETFCSIADAKLKAGANFNTDVTDSNFTTFINQAESYINNVIKIPGVNLVADFTNMQGDVKRILQDAASSHAAMAVINYDIDSYGASQAQTMLDFNFQRFTDAIALLKNKRTTDFLRSFNS
tara:strand:- start:728 stop:1096 length:369 start_codon:yes stop_codon:yes gene_type:complete